MTSLPACKDHQSVDEQWLDRFIEIYQQLDKNNLTLLQQIYHREVVFVDPIHRIEGLDNLEAYFRQMYQNLLECKFDIQCRSGNHEQASLYWQMHFRHKKLASGAMICVDGHSVLKMHQSKVIYHRDYFDTAAMLYEHIPLLGGIIRYLKNRIA